MLAVYKKGTERVFQVAVSYWLLAFSSWLVFSLECITRCMNREGSCCFGPQIRILVAQRYNRAKKKAGSGVILP